MPDLDFPVEDEQRPAIEVVEGSPGAVAEPDVEVVDEPEIVIEQTPARRRGRRLIALLAALVIVVAGATALAINISGDDGVTASDEVTSGGQYDCRPFGPRLLARPC